MRFIGALALVLSMAMPAAAEILTLKDGRVLRGAILSQDAQMVVLQTANGQIRVKREDIAKVVADTKGAKRGRLTQASP